MLSKIYHIYFTISVPTASIFFIIFYYYYYIYIYIYIFFFGGGGGIFLTLAHQAFLGSGWGGLGPKNEISFYQSSGWPCVQAFLSGLKLAC